MPEGLGPPSRYAPSRLPPQPRTVALRSSPTACLPSAAGGGPTVPGARLLEPVGASVQSRGSSSASPQTAADLPKHLISRNTCPWARLGTGQRGTPQPSLRARQLLIPGSEREKGKGQKDWGGQGGSWAPSNGQRTGHGEDRPAGRVSPGPAFSEQDPQYEGTLAAGVSGCRFKRKIGVS